MSSSKSAVHRPTHSAFDPILDAEILETGSLGVSGENGDTTESPDSNMLLMMMPSTGGGGGGGGGGGQPVPIRSNPSNPSRRSERSQAADSSPAHPSTYSPIATLSATVGAAAASAAAAGRRPTTARLKQQQSWSAAANQAEGTEYLGSGSAFAEIATLSPSRRRSSTTKKLGLDSDTITFDAPFFVTWFCSIWNILFLPLFVLLNYLTNKCDNKEDQENPEDITFRKIYS